MKNNNLNTKPPTLSLEDAFGYIKTDNKPRETQSRETKSQDFDKQIRIAKDEHAKETLTKL